MKVDLDERAALVEQAPDSYAVTPHYQAYPMVIVRLPKVRRDDLEERLVEAWRFCAPSDCSTTSTPHPDPGWFSWRQWVHRTRWRQENRQGASENCRLATMIGS